MSKAQGGEASGACKGHLLVGASPRHSAHCGTVALWHCRIPYFRTTSRRPVPGLILRAEDGEYAGDEATRVYCPQARMKSPESTSMLSLLPASVLTDYSFVSPSPPAASAGGEGRGEGGNPRRDGDSARTCGRCPTQRRWHRVLENKSSAGQPPHPRPFSPGKPRGRREEEGL